MAVLTMSAEIQALTASGTPSPEVAGETLAKNDALYIVTTAGADQGTVKKLVNTSEETATFYGFAMGPSKDTGVVHVLTTGTFEMASSTFTAGITYVASATAGKMQPAADLGSGDHKCDIGGAYSTTQFVINNKYIGVLP